MSLKTQIPTFFNRELMKNLPNENLLQRIRPKVGGNWDNDQIYTNTLMFYLVARELVLKKDILDAACGLGYGTYLLSLISRSAIGIDIDNESLSYACSNFKNNNLEFRKMNVSKLEFEMNKFDVVTSIETLEHIPPEDTENFFNGIEKVLKPGGTFIISTPNRTATEIRGQKMSGHINEMSVAELKAQLKKRFKEINYYYFLSALHKSMGSNKSYNSIIRFLSSFTRNLSFIYRSVIACGHLRGILRSLNIYEMCTQEDEKYGLFQIAIARKYD